MKKLVSRTVLACGLVAAVSSGVAVAATVAGHGDASHQDRNTTSVVPRHTQPNPSDSETPGTEPEQPSCSLACQGGRISHRIDSIFCKNDPTSCPDDSGHDTDTEPDAPGWAGAPVAASEAYDTIDYLDTNLPDLTRIMREVTDDPEAPLSDGDAEFVDDVRRTTESWNTWVGGVTNWDDKWDDTMGSIDARRNAELQHQAAIDAIDEINREITNINSWDGTWSFGLTPIDYPQF